MNGIEETPAPPAPEAEASPTVVVDAEGGVVTCPEGDVTQCGYQAGEKVCGKCGAEAVVAAEDEAEAPAPEMEAEAKAHRESAESPAEEAAENEKHKSDSCDCDGPEIGEDGLCTKCGKPVAMKKKDSEEVAEGSEAKSADDDDEELLTQKQIEVLDLRAKHLAELRGDMQTKSADDEEVKDGYLCSIERKVFDLDQSPCHGCTGGCQGAKGYPDLLMIEAIAAKTLDGEVVDSGYGSLTDLYLVDLKVKGENGDDEFVQAIYSGSGKMRGWLALDVPSDERKSGEDNITVQRAIDSALAQVKGEAVSIAADNVEGTDVYSVEVNGIDGKSYDVFVALDGTVVGWDEYNVKSDEEIAETPEEGSSETEIKGEEPAPEAKGIEGEEASVLASIMEFQALAAEIEADGV